MRANLFSQKMKDSIKTPFQFDLFNKNTLKEEINQSKPRWAECDYVVCHVAYSSQFYLIRFDIASHRAAPRRQFNLTQNMNLNGNLSNICC